MGVGELQWGGWWGGGACELLLRKASLGWFELQKENQNAGLGIVLLGASLEKPPK